MTADTPEARTLGDRIEKAVVVSLMEQHEKPGPIWAMPLSDAEQALIVAALRSQPGMAREGVQRAADYIYEETTKLDAPISMGACLVIAKHILSLSPIRADRDWQPIETRPDIDSQPGRQFILIEGSRDHSGVSWYRQHAGEAYIRKPGAEDEILQYRGSDVLRICKDGDIDPITARVTHWMPGAYPFFPSSSDQGGK